MVSVIRTLCRFLSGRRISGVQEVISSAVCTGVLPRGDRRLYGCGAGLDGSISCLATDAATLRSPVVGSEGPDVRPPTHDKLDMDEASTTETSERLRALPLAGVDSPLGPGSVAFWTAQDLPSVSV